MNNVEFNRIQEPTDQLICFDLIFADVGKYLIYVLILRAHGKEI